MTDDHRLHLAALLAARPRLEQSADGLLALLGASAEGDATLLAPRLGAQDVGWDALLEWLAAWPDPPASVADLRPWLRETEDLGRAEAGLGWFGGLVRADELRRAVTERLESLRVMIDARGDHALYAGEASVRRAVPPWTWIRRGDLARVLDDPDALPEVLRLATRAALSAEDEAVFAREVRALGADRSLS